MAERRRIIPASVGPDFYGTQEQPDRPTRRLTVTLPESSDKTSPEFSYIDLVKESGGTVEEEKSFNDIDEDDLTGMAALARKFEEKYGVAKGKKKRKRLEDVMDVGLGYDESDPFVDNSECYDELVPSVLTTRFGGFYINSGDLHFKEISGDSDDSDFQVQKRKKKTQKRKKRKALDSDDDKQMKSKKRQLSGSSDTAKKKIKKKLHRQFSSSIEEKKKKKKKLNLPKAPTIAELLKTKKDISSEKPQSTGPPNSNGPGIHNGPDISKVSVSGGGGAHSLENIDPSLDLGMAHLPVDSDMAAILNDTLAGIGDGDDLADVDMLGLQPNGDQEEEEVKMPLDVPSQLDKDVNKIKEAARKSMEGKCKFFTPSVNSLLLDIENQTRSLSCGKRSTIYNHLAYHLPCSKDTLLKRAKKLRLGAQDSQLKEPIIKLKEAISEVMPAQIERYQEECIAAEQAKQERIKEDKNDKNASQDEDEEKSRGPKSQAPRKKFFWTDHLRNLLCHVVSIKLKTYEMSKTRSQSAEDYLKAFLDAEIKDLWPPGWMQTRMLFKESRSVHSPITSMPPKQKKLIPPLKKPSQPKKIEQNPSQATLPASSSKETSPDPQRDHSRNISPYSGDSVSPSRVTTKPPGEGLTILDYAENSNDVENVEKELPQESDGGTLSLLASAMSEVVKKLEKEKTAGLKDSSSRTETEEPKHFSSTASESVDTKDKPDRSLSVSPPDNAHKSGVPPPSLKQLVSPSVLVKKPSSNNKEQGSLHSPPKVSPMHSPTASPLSVDSFSQPTVRLMRQPVLDKISSLHPDSRVIVKTLPPITDSKTHVSRKESHPPSSGSHLKRSSPNLAGAHSSKVPPVSPLSNYSKTPSPSTSPSGQESIRPQTMYTKHHPLSERVPHQLSSHSQKIPSSAHSPNSLQYQVTSTSHRVSPSRLSPGMTPNSMSYPPSHGGSGFGMSSQQSSLSSVQRPNPVKLSLNIPRRGSFPSMLNQVVSSPLTSPTLTAEDVSHPHSRGFQQISLADLTRKVSSSSHSSASYPRLSSSGMMGRSSSVDQVSPTLESGGMRPSLLPGMGYMPGQNRDPNYDNTSQGQPRLL